MNRSCGGCTLCCKLVPVRELAKGAGERCRYQSSKGCAVYHRPDRGFPPSCAVWNCRWLGDPATQGLKRPDRSHYVVDVMPDLVRGGNEESGWKDTFEVLQVWCDPAWPEAWRDPALLAYAAAEGLPLLVRYNAKDAIFVCPPALASDGKLHVMGDDQTITVASPTGSMLLDTLISEASDDEPPRNLRAGSSGI